MRIENLAYDNNGDYKTISALVQWEDSDRAAQTLFFSYGVDESYVAQGDYQPFVIAAVVPALRQGERRISVDGAICPWLKDNLDTFVAYLTNWYWYKYGLRKQQSRVLEIEARSATMPRSKQGTTGMFFSGGIDSLYTLRRNRLNIPRLHPGSVTDAIIVHGFGSGDYRTSPTNGGRVANSGTSGSEFEVTLSDGDNDSMFGHVTKAMAPVVSDASVNLIPVKTNIRALDFPTDVWLDEYMGCAMSAVAHGLAGRLSNVLVASSYEIQKLHPFANHPVIEPRLSSFHVRMHHDGERLCRVQRVKLVAEWPSALDSLRVCFSGTEEWLNCGRCPKCIRTRAELLCAGKLQDAHTMPGGEPTAGEIARGMRLEPSTYCFMSTLVEALREEGHNHLARAVRYRQLCYVLNRALSPGVVLKRVDQDILGGAIKRILGSMYPRRFGPAANARRAIERIADSDGIVR